MLTQNCYCCLCLTAQATEEAKCWCWWQGLCRYLNSKRKAKTPIKILVTFKNPPFQQKLTNKVKKCQNALWLFYRWCFILPLCSCSVFFMSALRKMSQKEGKIFEQIDKNFREKQIWGAAVVAKWFVCKSTCALFSELFRFHAHQNFVGAFNQRSVRERPVKNLENKSNHHLSSTQNFERSRVGGI